MMIDVLASEWVKIRSVRSTWRLLGVLGAFVLIGGLLEWNGVRSWDHLSAAERGRIQIPPPMEQTVAPLVQLSLAVLGMLAIASEYATGMIRTSVVAVPRRWPMLAAKVSVVAATALVAGEAVIVVIFFVTRWVVGDRQLPGYTSSVPAEAPMLLSLGLSVMMVALVGLGLGTALRSTGGALMVVVVLLFVLPTFSGFLPSPWSGWVSAVMLPSLPGQLAGRVPHALLPPLGALAVMTAYMLAAVFAGAVVLIRRDA